MSTIYISYDNIFAYLDSPVQTNISILLYDKLRYHPDGYDNTWLYKSGKWDGFERLYDTANNKFRVGLLNRVKHILEQSGYLVITKYTGTSTPTINHKFVSGKFSLYQHQSDAVAKISEVTHGIIVAPTGTGKSIIIASAIDKISKRTLVIVPDLILLDQMQQGLQGCFDQSIGMIGDNEFDLQEITVSTIQSLSSFVKTDSKSKLSAEKRQKFLNWSKDIGMVIVDEVHLAKTESYRQVFQVFTNTNKYIGTSATPYGISDKGKEKRDNLEIEQHFGTPIYDCRRLDFIALGLKVPVNISTVQVAPMAADYNIHKKKTRHGYEWDHGKNYAEALKGEITKNPNFHEVVARHAWSMAASGKSTFIYAAHSIEYGQTITSLIPGAVFINGSTKRTDRRDIYDALRRKDLLTLVTDVGVAGLDIPSLDGIIVASDMKDVRQLLGRVARKPRTGTKDAGYVKDFYVPTQFFQKHYTIRSQQYQYEGYPITIEED